MGKSSLVPQLGGVSEVELKPGWRGVPEAEKELSERRCCSHSRSSTHDRGMSRRRSSATVASRADDSGAGVSLKARVALAGGDSGWAVGRTVVTDFLSSNDGRTTLNRAILPRPCLLSRALASRLIALSRPPQAASRTHNFRAELQRFSALRGGAGGILRPGSTGE